MTDENYEARAQAHLASLKRDMRVSLEDAAVRAMHKVMAEFEAKSDERLMEDWGPGPHEHHSLPARGAEQPAPMIRSDIQDGLVDDEPAQQEPGRNHWEDGDVFERIAAMKKQPAQPQQEPVAVPTTSYEHRKFVLVGRDWYERFAAFHDDCQIGERLTREEQTVRQQGYENGWNDAQRYLKEPQSTSPTPAQRKPQQEPVAWGYPVPEGGIIDSITPEEHAHHEGEYTVPLYTSPPAQRTWVGLTQQEVQEIHDTYHKRMGPQEFAAMVEAKLKEKNHG